MIILPVTFMLPTTSNLSKGFASFMPTLPVALIPDALMSPDAVMLPDASMLPAPVPSTFMLPTTSNLSEGFA